MTQASSSVPTANLVSADSENAAGARRRFRRVRGLGAIMDSWNSTEVPTYMLIKPRGADI